MLQGRLLQLIVSENEASLYMESSNFN